MGLKFLTLLVAAFALAACGSTSSDEMATTTASGAAAADTGPMAAAVTPASDSGLDPTSQEYLVVNVGDRVFFDFDRSDIRLDAQGTLEKVAVWMRTYPSVTMTIEGHCDERGTREYNLALGERRANSVYDYLIALGIDPSRLSTISYGKERPAVLGSNDNAWAQNRRGVFAIN